MDQDFKDDSSRNVSVLDSTIPGILKKYEKLQKPRKHNLLSGIGKVVAKKQVFQLSDTDSDIDGETTDFKKPTSAPGTQVKKASVRHQPNLVSEGAGTTKKIDPGSVTNSRPETDDPSKSRRASGRRFIFEDPDQADAKSDAVRTWLNDQEFDIHDSPTVVLSPRTGEPKSARETSSPADFLKNVTWAEELVVEDEEQLTKRDNRRKSNTEKDPLPAKRLSGRVPQKIVSQVAEVPGKVEEERDKTGSKTEPRQATLADSNKSVNRKSRGPVDVKQTEGEAGENTGKTETLPPAESPTGKNNPAGPTKSSGTSNKLRAATPRNQAVANSAANSRLPAKARQETPIRPVRQVIRNKRVPLKRDASITPTKENQPASSSDERPTGNPKATETTPRIRTSDDPPPKAASIEGPVKAGTSLLEEKPQPRAGGAVEDVTVAGKPVQDSNHQDNVSRLLSTTRATAFNTTRKRRTSRFRSTFMTSKVKSNWRESVKLLTKPTLLEYSPGDQVYYNDLVQVNSDGEEIPIPKRKISVTPNSSPAVKSRTPTQATPVQQDEDGQAMEVAEQPPLDSESSHEDPDSVVEMLEDVPAPAVEISSRPGSRAGTPASASVARNRLSLLKRSGQDVSISERLFPGSESSSPVTPRSTPAQKRKSESLMSDTPVLSTEKVKRRISRSMVSNSPAQESDSSLDHNGNVSGTRGESRETPRSVERSKRSVSILDDFAEDLMEPDVELVASVRKDPPARIEDDEPAVEMEDDPVADVENDSPATQEADPAAENDPADVGRVSEMAEHSSGRDSPIFELRLEEPEEPAAQPRSSFIAQNEQSQPESTSSRRQLADQKLDLFRQSFILLQRQMEEVKNHLIDYLEAVKPE